MAYRQLIAVFLSVSALSGIGCGKGETDALFETPDSNDQPATNPEQPSSDSDQASFSSDAPPRNSDAPPGAGQLGSLCNELCDRLRGLDCEGRVFGEIESQGCEAECVVPAGFIPCETQFVGLFECILDLPTLCTPSTQRDEQGTAPPNPLDDCEGAIEAYADCADAYEQPQDQDSEPKRDCSRNGACQCDTVCESCECQNGKKAPSCSEICAL